MTYGCHPLLIPTPYPTAYPTEVRGDATGGASDSDDTVGLPAIYLIDP
jgi:hypothetical protein